MSVIEIIKSPRELHLIKSELLPVLVREIRAKIISVCSETGGHLGGSLGAVELITALHYVFNCPDDKIVFDVGHQAYAHKILTGRYGQFTTLRQFGGISGFPKISESPYDAFGTGHASTAISAAFGMACARDIKGENNKVIAVIGDGSLTGGLAYEGLNNMGSSEKNVLVILNDNAMFISPRIGAVGKLLTKLFTLGVIKKAETALVNFLKRVKFLGLDFLKIARRIKVIFSPKMLFEEMGFSCFGPVDGHNLENLILIFSKIKNFNGPVFLHVVTKKGKGYTPAEHAPSMFHGLGGFDVESGATNPSRKTYSDVFGETLCDIASHDKNVVAVTAAMTEGTGLVTFAEKFPDRFFDCGIAEEHAVTFAAGLASQGLKPVVAIYSTFLQRSFDQIIHDVCLQNLPVVFAVDRAGLVGEDGPTHHGSFDISYLRIIPNMIVAAPRDENEMRNMLYSAFEYKRPVAVRYPRGSVSDVARGNFNFIPAGIGEVLKKGRDVCLIAIGSMVYPSLLVANQLDSQGVKCGVVNARFAKPVDAVILNEAASSSKLIVTVEENTFCGGFGTAVLEEIQPQFRNRVRVISLPDRFVTHGSVSQLQKDAGIDVQSIFNRVMEFLK
ncbi:MAG: 1-deoxy-D-xylulose-5-phosphate synthase [bacterium]